MNNPIELNKPLSCIKDVFNFDDFEGIDGWIVEGAFTDRGDTIITSYYQLIDLLKEYADEAVEGAEALNSFGKNYISHYVSTMFTPSKAADIVLSYFKQC